MRRPTNHDFSVAHAWLEHAGAWWAWEQVYQMVEHGRKRAWRMVQVMVAYAPDHGALSYVAAGPVEDLCGEPLMLKEAENDPRFRVCLGMAYGLPENLERLADHKTRLDELPPVTPIEATPEEIRLMVGYFHHHDTSWAFELLEELTRRHPDEAIVILRCLLKVSAEMASLREDVFLHAFDLFVRLNFGKYRNELKTLAVENDDLRQWFLKKADPPINGAEGWTTFVHDLGRH